MVNSLNWAAPDGVLPWLAGLRYGLLGLPLAFAALPLLQWGGYVSGSQNAQALAHLSWAYALLPCALKLLAAALLYGLFIHRAERPSPPEGMLL